MIAPNKVSQATRHNLTIFCVTLVAILIVCLLTFHNALNMNKSATQPLEQTSVTSGKPAPSRLAAAAKIIDAEALKVSPLPPNLLPKQQNRPEKALILLGLFALLASVLASIFHMFKSMPQNQAMPQTSKLQSYTHVEH